MGSNKIIRILILCISRNVFSKSTFNKTSLENYKSKSLERIKRKNNSKKLKEKILTDSFQDNLLSPPVYTKPAEYKGLKVPDILLSGNFAKIDQWREEKAMERTKKRRPDLLK